MTSPYLILHKVRGKPAFDIAIILYNADGSEFETPSDPAPWWIIPTSGARAYPYKQWDLDDLADITDINQFGHHDRPSMGNLDLPPSWPDHYSINDRPPAPPSGGLLSMLGLANKIIRRV